MSLKSMTLIKRNLFWTEQLFIFNINLSLLSTVMFYNPPVGKKNDPMNNMGAQKQDWKAKRKKGKRQEWQMELRETLCWGGERAYPSGFV